MLKLLLCILAFLATGICLLQLRQQRMDLTYRNTQLHQEISQSQAALWHQQLQIAAFTAPNAIEASVDAASLNMVPRTRAAQAAADERRTPTTPRR
ncbi:MAG: hypothetical protein ACFCVE_04650 [Phycisphaerae bacterium]